MGFPRRRGDRPVCIWLVRASSGPGSPAGAGIDRSPLLGHWLIGTVPPQARG